MAASRRLDKGPEMASPWRRRRMCLLIAGDTPAPAALRDISATGARLETSARLAIGDQVELRHPEAGTITGEVSSISKDGVAIDFAAGERSIAFALAAIAADMSRPLARQIAHR